MNIVFKEICETGSHKSYKIMIIMIYNLCCTQTTDQGYYK